MKKVLSIITVIIGMTLFAGCSMDAETLEGLENQLSEVVTNMPEAPEDGLVTETPAENPTPTMTSTPTPTVTPTMTSTPTPTPTPKPTVVYDLEQLGELSKDTVRIGCYVTFGSYEQDNDFTNGSEPIEWLVLEVEDGKAMLFSRYALDFLKINETSGAVSWEDSTARVWLNQIFYNEAFSAREQQSIIETSVKNPGDKSRQLVAANDTLDKTFLLSAEEVRRYFPEGNWNNWDFGAYEIRTTEATAYAQYQADLDVQKRVIIFEWTEGQYKCLTLLRDVVEGGKSAVAVDTAGKIKYSGYPLSNGIFTIQEEQCKGITAARPAIWVDLDKLDSVEEMPTESAGILASDAKIGEYIAFGHYEQDNSVNNGKEALEWLVLDVQDDKALLVSRYVVDTKPFFFHSQETNWEDSGLRKWMNGAFFYTAFNEAERNEVILSTLSNDTDWKGNSVDGNDTLDSVFCLSAEEVQRYLPYGSDDRETIATEYAMDLGIGTLIYDYYIRSVDVENRWAIRVSDVILTPEAMPVGIRPAIWVKLHNE